MEGSDDGGDDVGAPNDSFIVSPVIQENIECNLVYILAPSIGYDVLQNDPTADQLELSDKSLADVNANAYEFEDLCCNSWRGAIPQQQQTNPGKRNGGRKLLQ